MRLRRILAGVLFSILAALAIVSIAQAEDGDDFTHGDLNEWFGEHFPLETDLRNAIWDLCGPSRNDACLLNQGHVFLGMLKVDKDDASAMAAFGKDPFSSGGLHGEPVASEELKGWIDDWLSFHAEGTANAVAEAAIAQAAADDANADAEATAQHVQAAADAANAAAQAAAATAATEAAKKAQDDAERAQVAADAASAAAQAVVAQAANAAAQEAQADAKRAQVAADAASAAAQAAEAAREAAATTERELPLYPKPTRTGETFQSYQLGMHPVMCHIMSDGYVECDPGAR